MSFQEGLHRGEEGPTRGPKKTNLGRSLAESQLIEGRPDSTENIRSSRKNLNGFFIRMQRVGDW